METTPQAGVLADGRRVTDLVAWREAETARRLRLWLEGQPRRTSTDEIADVIRILDAPASPAGGDAA